MIDNTKKNIPTCSLKTAVLFLIFNRLDTTKQVFETIREAKPQKLFIASDGPRSERQGEDIIVQAVREHVTSSIDWECEVYTLFRKENLGCGKAVSSAITWFFSQVNEGIILEDDCLPDLSFFPFCEDLLERYRDDKRIMMIGGTNFQFGRNKPQYSYYFSRYFHVWGWATWKRSWDLYDVNMNSWPEIRDNGYLTDILSDKKAVKYWEYIFNSVYDKTIDTWDYQWVFSCWIQGGLSIIPNRNLIKNIGFGPLSTHTSGKNIFSKNDIESIVFPLKHSKYVIRNTSADEYTEKIWFSKSHPIKRKINYIIKKIKTLFKKNYD